MDITTPIPVPANAKFYTSTHNIVDQSMPPVKRTKIKGHYLSFFFIPFFVVFFT